MKRFLAMLALLVLSVAAFALPSVEAVQNEVRQGNYARAESMMKEVVEAKPNSAKAHYVYAEILAHNGRFEQAAQEARLARQLDPKIGFTQPEKFSAFERLLEQQAAAKSNSVAPATPPAVAATPSERGDSGVPAWVWGLGFAVAAVLVWRLVSARRQANTMMTAHPAAAGTGYGAPPGGYGAPGAYGGPGGYGAAGYGPGGRAPGSGMLGTGLAAAGGFAAGMLAEKMLDGRHENDAAAAGTGGLVPGMFDDPSAHNPAADELEERPIDLGSGGDWDSDAGGGDAGGDGGGDGW